MALCGGLSEGVEQDCSESGRVGGVRNGGMATKEVRSQLHGRRVCQTRRKEKIEGIAGSYGWLQSGFGK